MTNARIILNESLRLMDEGVLKGTGKYVQIENADGSTETIELPEEIHTFSAWKERGYSVKKGAKAVAKFPIWKYTEKKKDEDELTGNPLEDAPITHMFMKMSAFFTFEQVEPTKAKHRKISGLLPAPTTANA